MRPLKALISKSTINRAHTGITLKNYIQNPKYEDAIKYGNVILISDENILRVYIASNRESLPKEFQEKISKNCDIVFIKYDINKYGFSYWDATSFEKKFPYNKNWDEVKIEKIWNSEVDLKTIKPKNFRALYDEICSKIK